MKKSKYSLQWRSSKDEDGNKKSIAVQIGDIVLSRELPSYIDKHGNVQKGARVFAVVDIVEFLRFHNHSMILKNWNKYQEYIEKYKIGIGGHHLCISEKIMGHGRMQFDFDLSNSEAKDYFLQQYKLVEGKPITFYEDLKKLFYDVLYRMEYREQANMLLQQEIEWQTYQHEEIDRSMNYGSPICISDSTRQDKVSIHISLPFIPLATRTIKNIYGEDETIVDTSVVALQHFMSRFYSVANELALQRWKWLEFIEGRQLFDRSLLMKSHDLRLPGYTKFEHLGRQDCELKIVTNNNITHAISSINYLHVPENLYIYIPISEIESTSENMQRECNILEVDVSDIEFIWEQLQNNVPGIENNWSGIEPEIYNDSLIFRLKPIGNPEYPVCNRIHDVVIPHVENTERGYRLSCWQYKRKKDTKSSGNVWLTNTGITLWQKKQWNDQLKIAAFRRYEPLYTRRENLDVIEIYEQEIDELPEIGDVYVCSAMGTGKTKGIYDQIEHSEDSYILVSNRIIQARKYKIRLPNATIYSDITIINEKSQAYSWNTVHQLIVQLESLYNVTKSSFSIVILDEIETILRLIISDTNRNREIRALNKIIQYITAADRVFVMDAFLKVETVRWIKSYRPQSSYRILVNMFKQIDGRTQSMDEQRLPNQKQLLVYDKFEQWLGDLYSDEGHKVVTVQSRDKATRIAQELEKMGQKTLLITSISPDYIKYGDPHNSVNGWNKFHNIVYTSALANSISFEKEWFNTQYVYCVKGSSGPEDLVQMMGRVRDIQDNKVYMFVEKRYIPDAPLQIQDDETVQLSSLGSCQKFLAFTEKQIEDRMKEGCKYFSNENNTPLLVEIWNTIDTKVQNLFKRLYVDHGLGQRFLGDITIHILKEILGWEIIYNYTSDKKSRLQNAISKNHQDYKTFIDIVSDSWIGEPGNGISHYGADHIYDKIWCRNKIPILNMASMVRGGEYVGDSWITDHAIKIRGYIAEIFQLGGKCFDTCLKEKCKINLQFNSNTKILDKLNQLAICYGIKSANGQQWEWLGKFFKDQLMLDGTMTRKRTKDTRYYIYSLDMTDWVWYHIKEK